MSHAEIALLQPPRVIDATKPLTLSLLISADSRDRIYEVPATLTVRAAPDLVAPVTLTLKRTSPGPEKVRLRQGEQRIITYQTKLPPTLRGQVRLEPADIDAAPVIVTLNRAPGEATLVAKPTPVPPETAASAAAIASADAGSAANAGGAAVDPATPVSAVTTTPAPLPRPDLYDQGRLTFNDPMYIMAGAHDGANAKFQFSFKFRIFQGENPASKGLLQNLYFGYTQFSLWDLAGDSKPFYDTNYRPSLFYYLPDTGVANRYISRLSIATGLEHESNGRGGTDSRSINTAFIKPTFYLGDQTDWHWTVAPKVYAYLEKSDNNDIQHYRGFMDLKLAYGKADSWEVSTTLRKGTRKDFGSADTLVSYPLERLIPGTAGYLMAGFFYGYGESLLDYNRKVPWQFRLGYALSR